jgi:hypothetical protein
MSNRDDNKDPVISSLHPRIYVALVGFALWFALAVWGFAGPGEVDYLLVIVGGFVCLMSRVPRADHAPAEDAADAQPLRRWLRATFATEQDQLTGTEAATLILLPIAAGAIGMTLFGIIFSRR